MARRKDKTESSNLTLSPAVLANLPSVALSLGRGGAVALNARATNFLAEANPALMATLAALADKALDDGTACRVALAESTGGEVLLLPLADEGHVLAVIHDAPLEHRLREALIESRQRYKDLVDISADFAWETDEAGRFTFVSPRGVLGWSADALAGRPAAEFLAEPGEHNVFAATVAVNDAEVWFRRADGGSARLGIIAAPLTDRAGKHRGARGIGHDLTVTRARDAALAHAQLRDRLFTHVLRASRDEVEPEAALATAIKVIGLALGAAGGVVLRHVGGETAIAASWGEVTGTAAIDAARAVAAGADSVALTLGDRQLIGASARCRQAVEGAILLWRHSENGSFPDADRVLLADMADQLGVVIAQVAQHEHMLALSRTDPLTGLMNRRAFFEELERRLRRLAHGDGSAVLLYIDMDNFKLVNDRFGHRAGDEAIHALCHILRESCRGGDLLARLGGDEFALWIDGLGHRAGSERARALLVAAGALSKFSGDPARPLGISIGLAVVEPGLTETPEQLLARADAAMYRAKQGGKGDVRDAEPAATVVA
jgi:diguanylate cyclase (GGDEF)-like protein/PAS domain S-box-containing protein